MPPPPVVVPSPLPPVVPVSAGAPLFDWLDHRAAGVLLHPTSFPGSFGVGSLEPSAVDPWLTFLSTAGIRYWQICPLGPTGYGDSPYQCFSAFAGNPYLIDLGALQRIGLLTEDELRPLRSLPQDRIDFGRLYTTKRPVLFRAFEAYKSKPTILLPYGDFAEFREAQRDWLDSFSLFLALKDHYQGQPWWLWPEEMLFFQRARATSLPDEITVRAEAHAFFQYLFFGQWREVRNRAEKVGVSIIGDAPIFVARDSADVWAHPELFRLDQETGHPLVVAGVPPDYFSSDGQLWGNPLYAWEKHGETGYEWWLRRLRANFSVCDVLRIDHFRAFDSYWAIPAGAVTAKNGSWQGGPGLDFFRALRKAIPGVKLIAEDLGELTPSVTLLRQATGLPGMTIFQFAFGGDAKNIYLPHHLRANNVVYPGTHDNDTSLGWYQTASDYERDHVRRYLQVSGTEVGWDFARAAYESVSNLAIIPLQDLMSLGSEARLNTPGKAAGNWQWRYRHDQLAQLQNGGAHYLYQLGELYGRLRSVAEEKKT